MINTTDKTHSADGSLTRSESERRHQAWAASQPTRTSCARCTWSAEGPAAEVREQFASHVRTAHPEVSRIKRRRRTKDEDRAEAMKTVAERAAAAEGRPE